MTRTQAGLELPFRDRREAGQLLGREVAARVHLPDPLVLALARGGVPVGVEVAKEIDAPLDVIVVRKLGVPWQPELAMGAIARGTQVLDHDLIANLHVSSAEVEEAVAQETAELERREKEYRGGEPEPPLRGRSVILVDDGLATGSSMLAAARHASRAGASKLIVAVPVGTAEACHRLDGEVGECICLAMPEPFCAVGEWYRNFRQVSDAEVCRMLNRVRQV